MALPLQTSNNANIIPAAAGGRGKTIEETYQKKSQLEHILLRPDTYVGSIEKHTQKLWVYEDDQMVHREVSYVPGLYKIFDEILVNAADNKQRDPSMNSLKVVIDVELNCIGVYNNGDGVPVEIHQEEKVYVPELIFGHLLTSSNYDDTVQKTTGGRNGYGAKLTNIFSTEFVIETADGRRQKKYKQVFSNNMGKKSEPVITKCKEGDNWTKVTFKPDLAKFNMTHLEDDAVALMKKRVVDLAGCLGDGVKVELNGKRIPVKSFQDYVDLYIQTKTTEDKKPPRWFYSEKRWEICVSTSDGQFQQVSFVNSIATTKGGTHVDYITNQVAQYVMEAVNKKKKNANVKAHTVKNHLWVFVNALIDNPAFDSQTKETLTTRSSSFGSTCKLPDEFLKKVTTKSGIVESLLSWVDFKQSKDLKKTDGAKRQRLTGIAKLEDANEAGGRNSDKCTLILTEGDSAKALAMSGLGVVGRDYYGVFPLRGKLLNVREASVKQVLENAEIQSLKRILGLQQDKKYEDVKSLRYGHLMIMTDQDHDGSHIKGLLINFVHTFWPSLLRVPSFLIEFITPLIKATYKSGKVLSFYSMPDYEAWLETLGGNLTGWTIKYYKGLGTSNSIEGKEYFRDLQKHRKDFIWVNDQDGDAIELAFSKKKIEARKSWLLQYEPGISLDQRERYIKYSDFVHKELIQFSMADLQRSIPSMLDGLKPGQRKVLFCAFKRNLVKEAKISQFGGYVSEKSAYHHGEQSIYSTIIGMAQDFVGSNNINLLEPAGQFGTRCQGGKDHASARYINTRLNPIARFLFPKEDDMLFDYLREDGLSVEPIWYVPIIPMVLVNGSEGIGTGWSSYVPNYNPRDIIANIRNLLDDEPVEPMDPWYRGFKGTIAKTNESGTSYIVSGIIEEVDETTVSITELPIRRWTQDYKEFLESNMVDLNDKAKENDKIKDRFIKDVRDYSTDTIAQFEVTMEKQKLIQTKQEGLLKKLKLTTTINTTNMHLFDKKGVIKKYENAEQILLEFFDLRLEFYEKRKQFFLDNLEKELLKLTNKVRFILGVVSGEIILMNRKKAALVNELRKKGFTAFPKKAKTVESAVVGANDNSEEAADDNSEAMEETSGDAGTREADASDYDYLLSMALVVVTYEKVQELCAEKDKVTQQLDEMRMLTPKSLWLKDLDALEKALDEQDRCDAEKAAEEINGAGAKASKQAAKKPPRKNNKKKTSNVAGTSKMADPTHNMVDSDDLPEVGKPNGRVGPKTAAVSKKMSLIEEDEEEDMEPLRVRLAAYNLDSSPDNSAAMETNAPKPAAAKKEPSKRTAAKEKSTMLQDISDDEDDNDENDDVSDEDFEVEVVPEPEAGTKKGRGRPRATAAKAKPAAKTSAAAAAKKRGPASKQSQLMGQKLITEILNPSEAPGISPEKKVRKMRASPFNKKSGSSLGRSEEDEGKSITESKDKIDSTLLLDRIEEDSEVVMPVKRRSQREAASRRQTTVVLSDSESEEGGSQESEDSDFNEEDDE